VVVVADLVARVSAQGAQEAATQVKAVGDQAKLTADALRIMAEQMARTKDFGGTAAQALDVLQRSGAQPTAAALAEAARAAEKTAAAVTATVAPAKAAAAAAREHSQGWNASESSMIRFGAALLGVNLGISMVAGAARMVHQAIADIVSTQLDWERSLVNLSGLYGETGARAAALANAQASLPGVLGTQQEFAQAAINASALTLRYGLPQRAIDQLTTTGGRVAFATGMTNEQDRLLLQQQILQAVQTGAALPARYGVYTDPEAVSRRLGFQGGDSLQAFTPQQVMSARAAIVGGDLSAFADRAAENRRAALDAATAAEKTLEQARTNRQTFLESTGGANAAQAANFVLSAMGSGPALGLGPEGAGQFQKSPALQATAQEESLGRLVQAQVVEAAALADSKKAQDEARQSLMALSETVEGAGARLLSFFGSLESPTSIGHGDILAQAQAAVTARARSAVPTFGMGPAEIAAIAAGTSAQQAWQNFVAPLAQQEQTNVIQRNLERLAANPINPTPDRANPARQTAAQRALAQIPLLDPINRGLGEATTRAAGIDLATADTQARLEAITLTQRERYVQLLRDTVDLRRLDIQQQMVGVEASQRLIRAQQAALPSQQIASAGRYDQALAQAISQQRMARLLQGQDVSGLPSVDELINMQVRGQLIEGENAPSLVRGARGVELAGQGVTATSLAQALTEGQLRSAEMANDLKNLNDLPQQTTLELELVQNNRDQLSVQTEVREYLKQLVWIMTNQPAQLVPADRADRQGASTAPPAPSDLPGARHQ